MADALPTARRSPRSRWRRILRWTLLLLFLPLLGAALGLGALTWKYQRIVGAGPGRIDTGIQPTALGREVDPFIGTGGVPWVCGHNFPGADVPFGVMRLGPETASLLNRTRALNTSGYYYGDEWLLGFSHTRLLGTGATDGGNFLVRPANGPISLARPLRQRGTRFSHAQETASPGYYAVRLVDEDILAELTASLRVGLHRYTFHQPGAPHLHLHVANTLGGKPCREAEVRVLPGGREIEGSARTFGSFASRYGGLKAWFVARVDPPLAGHTLWKDGVLQPGLEAAAGDDVGVDLSFPAGDGPRVVELRVALSHVSLANARENLAAEAAGRDFATAVGAAQQAWDERLDTIRIDGGTPEQREIFRTALFRCFQMPTVFNDVNGQYLGFDGQVHTASGFRHFTDLSIWDTFRTLHPLLTLLAPEDQRDMLRSLVRMVEEGGWLPRWPAGAGYSNSMFGTPADILVADSYLKGVRDFDVAKAYEAMKRTALGPTPPGAKFSGRRGIEPYLQFGYCPGDLVPESVARTLEYAWADDAIARLAEALGHADDARLFRERAQAYRHLWNPATGHFQARDSQGRFMEPFDPLLLTYLDRDGRKTRAYVEGSALQWRWAVPFDVPGLISLFPDRTTFVTELESFFTQSNPGRGRWNPGPYYWHGNQPDLFAAYLFNDAGRPDLTRRWVHWILQHKYGTGHEGLDGNDDGGTLSAWYVFGALGFHPVPGSDRYQLGLPIFPRAEVRLGANRLTILSEEVGAAREGVEGIWLNATRLDRPWIRHDEIARGGTLRFAFRR